MKKSGLALAIFFLLANNAFAETAASVASSNAGVYFEAEKPLPYMPGTVAGSGFSPNLFNIIGRTAQIGGLPLLSQTTFSKDILDVTDGISNNTNIIFTSARIPKRHRLKDRKVMCDLGGVGYGEVIGSLTIESKKDKTKKVDLSALIYDAVHYIQTVRNLRGYNITLLTSPEAISWIMGVDSKSDGLAIAPVLSGLVNGAEGVLLGLAGGPTHTRGITVPVSTIGCSFLVVIDSEKSKHIDISKPYVSEKIEIKPESSDNGNNKNPKKETATHSN